jgi:DNA-binding MarR family transcriptional regulator
MATEDRVSNFTFLLREVARRFVLRFEEHARAISLTVPQCKVLVRLEKNEGVSQARLAELTDVDAMTMVRILDRMESEGLLERRPDPADRRARCLYLTPKARPLVAEIMRLGTLTRSEVFSGIRKTELDSFMDVLERMDDNLNKIEGRTSVTARQVGHGS